MTSNDIKKGARVQLRNGWYADILDSRKGNIRTARVHGDYTEIGSVYAHDVLAVIETDGRVTRVEHTPAQEKLRKELRMLGLA